MQTPDEISARWQPAPNSTSSNWINTLNSLATELIQLQELREQRVQEREIASSAMETADRTQDSQTRQQRLSYVILLDRVITHVDAEIAKLRRQECDLELALSVA